MRIINIILTSENGGAEQVFVDYSIILKKLGHEVLAITKEDAPYANKILELGITVKKIQNNFGDFDIFASKKIARIIREFNADAVFAHVGRSMVLVRRALKKIKNKKVFLVAINHSINVKRSIGSDVILSVNQEIFYKTILAGQPENKTFVIPNATDLANFKRENKNINLVDKKEITIGVMGRFDKTKGFDIVMRALKKLTEISDKNFILHIAGSGKEESNLMALAQSLGLENKVKFLGWIKDKKEFFDNIDIFCMSSYFAKGETFGLVLLEAMKYSVPIISTKADGPREVLRDGIDALMVNIDCYETIKKQIIDAVIKMVSEDGLAGKLVENSGKRLEERFSYAALEKKLQEIVGMVK